MDEDGTIVRIIFITIFAVTIAVVVVIVASDKIVVIIVVAASGAVHFRRVAVVFRGLSGDTDEPLVTV